VSNLEYKSIIGLEVHAQLLTESKIFCGCSTKYGSPPNSQTCPVCLGMPGALPVLNKKAVEYAIKMILAVEGRVNPKSIFARKNYFYPDLPKGYQISQYDQPLGTGGYVEIELSPDSKRKIGLTRIHLEEDAGKSIHLSEFVQSTPPKADCGNGSNRRSIGEDGSHTLVDMNRCGVLLIEIVSEPEIFSPEEGYLYLLKLKQIMEYLEICSGNMEEGNLRCDANVSVRGKGVKEFGTKVEVKNMNSFKGVEKALSYVIKMEIDSLRKGEKIIQQTMLWDEEKEMVFPMRTKEESQDYRYFPEPDLVTLKVDSKWIEKIRKSLPELPEQRRERFAKDYKIPLYDAKVLTTTKELADYYEECVKAFSFPKIVSNWVMGEVLREVKERRIKISDFKVKPQELAFLLKKIEEGVISGKMAKEIFAEMAESRESAKEIIEGRGLVQVSDRVEIEKMAEEVLKENPGEVEKYLSGKDKVFGFFVGEVMKKTKGKANPKMVNEILREKLGK